MQSWSVLRKSMNGWFQVHGAESGDTHHVLGQDAGKEDGKDVPEAGAGHGPSLCQG
jgi:hypothetical protein